MAHALIAWELGEAFGHLARCVRLAEGLVARGHKVTLALKNVGLPAGQMLVPGITVLVADHAPTALLAAHLVKFQHPTICLH